MLQNSESCYHDNIKNSWYWTYSLACHISKAQVRAQVSPLGFMAAKVLLRQIIHGIFRFFPLSIIPPLPHIYSVEWAKGLLEAQLYRVIDFPHLNCTIEYSMRLTCATKP